MGTRSECLNETAFCRERMVMRACLSQVKPQPVPAAVSMRLWRCNSQYYRLRTGQRRAMLSMRRPGTPAWSR
nr:hypothetical protein BDOA9_0163630 [Bradyrhizobium sp. DOA9]